MKNRSNTTKILLYGFGNPGRQDDGIGIEFVDCMEQWINDEKFELTTVQVDRNFQLNVEDAEIMANQDIVIFIDASKENISDFYLSKVTPSSKSSFSMHSVSPGYLLNLCDELYQRHPLAFVLHIKGYRWDVNGKLTEKAQINLCKALNYLQERIKDPAQLLTMHNRVSSIDIKK